MRDVRPGASWWRKMTAWSYNTESKTKASCFRILGTHKFPSVLDNQYSVSVFYLSLGSFLLDLTSRLVIK